MQLQCHDSAKKKQKKAKNEHKTPHKNFQQKSQTNKSYIMVVTVTPLFYGGMAYDIDFSWLSKNKLESYMGK